MQGHAGIPPCRVRHEHYQPPPLIEPGPAIPAKGRLASFFIAYESNPMVNITLPDGSQRRFENPVTVGEVAASIGAGLAKAALAGKVDGKLVDTSFRIENDARLE